MSDHGEVLHTRDDSHTRYDLVRRLRATAMSQVYEARRAERRFLVEMLDGLVGLPAAQAAFTRAVRLTSSPPHPYVVPVLELSYLPDGTPLAVSELPEGPTLEQWLAGSPPLSQRSAVGLVMALADVLAEMHARGVGHGALAADQVYLVGSEGCVAGLPRLYGFGFGWLCGASGELAQAVAAALKVRARRPGLGAAERAADLAALAGLARRLLAAASFGDQTPRGRVEGRGSELALLDSSEGTRRASVVLARAMGKDGTTAYASPLAFALALEAALAPPATLVLPAMARPVVAAPEGAAVAETALATAEASFAATDAEEAFFAQAVAGGESPRATIALATVATPLEVAAAPAVAAPPSTTPVSARVPLADDDEPLSPARHPRLALLATGVAGIALTAGLLALVPLVSGTKVPRKDAPAAPAVPVTPPPVAPAERDPEPAASAPAAASVVLAAALPAPVAGLELPGGGPLALGAARHDVAPAAPTPADQVATPPQRGGRGATLPRARRGLIWSARLGRVVPIEEEAPLAPPPAVEALVPPDLARDAVIEPGPAR